MLARYRGANMYDVKNGVTPESFSQLFVRKGSLHLLQSNDFELPHFHTTCFGKHSITYLGPFLLSNLSNNEWDSPRLASFRNKIKVDLSNNFTNSSNCSYCTYVANRFFHYIVNNSF